MTGRNRRSVRSSSRRARFTAGVAGLTVVAGAVAGAVLVAAGPSAAVASGSGSSVTTITPAAAVSPTLRGAGGSVADAAAGASGSVAGASGSVAGAGASVRTWAVKAASVSADPARIVAGVRADQPVRIVSVRTIGGRPSVSSVTVTGRASATAAVAAAQQDAATVSVGVDEVVHLTDDGTATAAATNDPLRSRQWALTTLKAETDWTKSTGSGVTVAVIDTGVQASHPDLAGQVLKGIDLVGDKPASTDGSNDENGHGTHVAGIIAAVANNKIGVAGLAPNVKILPIRVLDADGSGYDSDMAKGIIQAVDRGAKVINLSVGGTEAGATSSAVQYALSKNVTVVAAAGNERQDGNATSYPAADAGVIGVAATDSTNKDADFSNTGSYVDVAAPGVSILSTYMGSQYATMSGTSMATPYVAATAALLKSVSPGLTPAQVTTALESTATDLGAAGRDDVFGYGLINPYAALCGQVSCDGSSPTVATAFRLASGAGSTVVAGTRVTVRATLTDASTGEAIGGSAVSVCVRTLPAPTLRCTATTTAATGAVTWTGIATGTTTVYFTHDADATTTASSTATATYTATAKTTLRAGKGTLTATVTPATRQGVTLDRWSGKTWVKVSTKTSSAAGVASFTKLKPATYRVRVAAGTATAASTSTSARVS
ncbi:S8 family peptidase [Cryptosporangium phraense]|uniref:Peptidase S8 n=1 Tax=Cryptosporangium phraense TaxID=2593070 RepID=A0A545ADY6_9ACTN|nr:S8 family peptidase [Cryptosporangium phraense]TQS39544.1 peptidase S8 [Cryptosporangium phraense]